LPPSDDTVPRKDEDDEPGDFDESVDA
jgi:hypothetical protein